MPKPFVLGLPTIPASVASKLLAALPAAKTALQPIQWARYARNGKRPDVAMINQLNELANQCVLYRTKEVFRATGKMTTEATILSSGGAGDRARWRFAFHTGPYTHTLMVRACMIPQDSSPGSNSYARLDIATSATGSPAVASATLEHGPAPWGTGTVSTGWTHYKWVTRYITVSPDTDYYGTFYDVDNGRLVAACVSEYASMTEHFDGYLPQNLAAQSHIVDVYREYLAAIVKNLHRRGGATVLNWSVDDGTAPQTRAGGTSQNLIDNSSTTISAATPGFTLQMDYVNRVSQTSGVPCVMKVYGSKDGTQNDGEVYLKDSAGNTIASVTNVFTSTAQWHSSGVFNLPAATDKYDLQFARAGIVTGTLSVYAVSIYQYET